MGEAVLLALGLELGGGRRRRVRWKGGTPANRTEFWEKWCDEMCAQISSTLASLMQLGAVEITGIFFLRLGRKRGLFHTQGPTLLLTNYMFESLSDKGGDQSAFSSGQRPCAPPLFTPWLGDW